MSDDLVYSSQSPGGRSPLDALLVERLQSTIPGLRAVYLFGSMAEGGATAESDVDIAILADGPVSASRRFDLAQILASDLGRDVDLVDLQTASAVFRSQIIGRGRSLFRRDEREAEAFEDFVFSDYARLNEERAGILSDVRERGRIHGD